MSKRDELWRETDDHIWSRRTMQPRERSNTDLWLAIGIGALAGAAGYAYYQQYDAQPGGPPPAR